MPKNVDQENSNTRPKPVILVILDGWGVARNSKGNAVTQAKTPNINKYIQEYFCSTLQASGEAVGLPWNEMGNSEVGHLNIGAGKIVYQSLPRINKSITSGDFFSNPVFVKACKHVQSNQSNLHLVGLLSSGGVHSDQEHLYALLDLAKKQGINKVFVHVILDGRDTPYNSGLNFVKKLQDQMNKIGVGQIVTISGRFWAMDRDNHWERTKEAYYVMTGQAGAITCDNPEQAIQASYDNNVFDEEFKPVIIQSEQNKFTPVAENDAVVFFNFRADRGRQLTKSFVLPTFDKFENRTYLKNLFFVTMTQYEQFLPVEIAFPPEIIEMPLARVVSEAGLKQLHIAETEKYAHVTYFIDGGREKPFEGEDQVLIPSPRVSSYDQKPNMSAKEIKDRVIKEINQNKYDLVIINFANSDMVAHTGNLKATIKSIETVDECLGEVVDVSLNLGGVVIVTADHGNAEELIKLQSGYIDKEHSTAPVPFIVIGESYRKDVKSGGLAEPNDLSILTPTGVLADVAPTILNILNIDQPECMIGRSLI